MLYLGQSDLLAESGQSIVTPALVIQLRVGAFVRLDNQAIDQHFFDGAVERRGTDAQLTLCLDRDLLHNAVTVSLTTGQGEQDVKDRRGQWEQLFWVPVRKWHLASPCQSISISTIPDMGIICQEHLIRYSFIPGLVLCYEVCRETASHKNSGQFRDAPYREPRRWR